MTLFTYMEDCERFLRDGGQRYVNPQDIKKFVNRARREIAMRSQCIRLVPPISGPITTLTVVHTGSGYTSPTLTISAPDSPSAKIVNPAGLQATGTATQIGGQISNASVTFGGDGYFQPTVTVSDPHGSGAVVTAQTVPLSVINPYQEEYAFANFPVSTFPGVASVFAVLGVSSLFNNLRYSWVYKSFSEYQAYIRTYTQQYFYTPVVWSQYGQGANGTFLCYPIPSEVYQMEPDCLCIPSDLNTDQDFEALAEPWTDAVAYGATALIYQTLQNANMSAMYWKLFDSYMDRYSIYANVGRRPMTYGRRY